MCEICCTVHTQRVITYLYYFDFRHMVELFSVHFQTPVVSWYYQDGEKICILLPIDKSWLAPVGKTPMVADKAANLKRQGSQGIGKGGNQNYRFSYEIYTLMHLKDFCKVLYASCMILWSQICKFHKFDFSKIGYCVSRF